MIFCQNLILRNIDLLESLIVENSVLRLRDNMPPLLVVCIDQVLNLKPNPGLERLILPMFKQIVANQISVIKVDDLVAPLLFILQVLLGLSAKVHHELVHHIAHDLNVLVIKLLLEIIETCLDDVAIELSCDI